MNHKQELEQIRRERDDWRMAHRNVATALNATDRGRDHCDAMLVVTALKRIFHITGVRVATDASYVEVTTDDGVVHRVETTS